MGIKICTSPYICLPSQNLVRNSSYTPRWILFILAHTDQHDMKMTVKIGFFAMLQVWHMLWDFVSLFQNTSLSTFHQVIRVSVNTIKVNPLHDCITIVLGKELFMGSYGHISIFLLLQSWRTHFYFSPITKLSSVFWRLSVDHK